MFLNAMNIVFLCTLELVLIKVKVHFLLFFLIGLVGNTNSSFAQSVILRGKVRSENHKPLAFATVEVDHGQQRVSSNAEGDFSIPVFMDRSVVHITINYVGKRTLKKVIHRRDFSNFQVFELQELSMTLEGVSIVPTYESTKNSNSSIYFDKETIEATQAFSLQDVLGKLPGKESVAPDLNKLQTLTLRGGNSELGGAMSLFNLNNSLGIAIIIDEVYLSNDANMQSRSASRWGITGASLSGGDYHDSYLGNQRSGSYDVAFQGVDLREIPVNNIESIEVIQGVASAKYGEITDGAVIINRQAGASPWSLNMQINGGSVSSAISKGFALGRMGALNLSTNYTNSNADPRDKIKTFNRINQSLMWTTRFAEKLKNTLSFDYNYRNDHRRMDPDDVNEELSKFYHKGFSVSNRLAFATNNKLFNTVNMNVNYSRSEQYSYKQYILNRGITAITVKDTIGIYKGYFSNGSYLAKEEVIGEPVSLSVKMDASSRFSWGASKHQVNYGISYNQSNNGGKGIISDPDRPRWILNGGGNERAYDFEQLPTSRNWGVFLEDNISGKVKQKDYSANIGLRADIQNGFLSVQPRINTSLKWSDQWTLTASYGISSKAPTLAHMYPAPVYIDIELLKVYAGDLSKALYLVYTDKKLLDNHHLKPSMSAQIELGLRYRGKRLSSALFLYKKNNWNGFESVNNAHQYVLPDYHFAVDQSTGEISYWTAGTTSNYFDFYGYEMTNGATANSLGLDWVVNLNQLKAIGTTFSIANNIQYNSFKKTQPFRIKIENNQVILPDQTSMTYAIYAPNEGNYLQLMSKVNSSTHIPKVGFIINFSADVFWKERTRTTNSVTPYAYYNSEGTFQEIAGANLPADILARLNRVSSDVISEDMPFVHTIVNMSLVKEISRKFRINLNAYNLFNIRPEYYKITEAGTEQYYKYNRRPSFTIGTNIKF